VKLSSIAADQDAVHTEAVVASVNDCKCRTGSVEYIHICQAGVIAMGLKQQSGREAPQLNILPAMSAYCTAQLGIADCP